MVSKRLPSYLKRIPALSSFSCSNALQKFQVKVMKRPLSFSNFIEVAMTFCFLMYALFTPYSNNLCSWTAALLLNLFANLRQIWNKFIGWFPFFSCGRFYRIRHLAHTYLESYISLYPFFFIYARSFILFLLCCQMVYLISFLPSLFVVLIICFPMVEFDWWRIIKTKRSLVECKAY